MNWRIECQTCAKAQGVGCEGVCSTGWVQKLSF